MYLDGPTRLLGSILESLLGTALPILVTIRADYYQDGTQLTRGVECSCESMELEEWVAPTEPEIVMEVDDSL
jgi:hypothetical protein